MRRLLCQDEPTSGLDAAAAFHVTSVIRRLCTGEGGGAGGRTVLAVIHQPASEVFALFDTLALLAGGATVYFGPADSAADFLASAAQLPVPHNRSAADHLLHAVNADFGDADDVARTIKALLAAYEASPLRAALDESIAAANAAPGPAFGAGHASPSTLAQVGVLTRRTLANNSRDIGVFWIRLVMYVMLCFCIGVRPSMRREGRARARTPERVRHPRSSSTSAWASTGLTCTGAPRRVRRSARSSRRRHSPA